jgi:hypothetical protein
MSGLSSLSFGAVGALAVNFGSLSREIKISSQSMGVSTDYLQEMRGAANAAGVSTADLNSGMRTFGVTLNDALNKRNPVAMEMLERRGIAIHKTADGIVDVADAYDQLANSIAELKDPQAQGTLARIFGVESNLPLMRKGASEIRRLREEIKKEGGVMSPADLDRGDELSASGTRLKANIGFTADAIGNKMTPALIPFIDGLSNWSVANRDLISTAAPFAAAVATIGGAIGGAGLIGKSVWGLGALGAGGAGLGIGTWINKNIEETNHGISFGSQIYDWLHPNEGKGSGIKPIRRTGAAPGFAGLESRYGLPRGVLDSVWRAESGRGAQCFRLLALKVISVSWMPRPLNME